MEQRQEIIRNVGKWGNSAGILLPKEWLGNQVKIILIDRTLEIKKEIFSILEPYLENLLGIYLVGSYARGEQGKESDIDILVVSKSTKKEINSGKYHVVITTLESVRKSLDYDPILIMPRLYEAKVIINLTLLEELKSIKLTKKSFKEFKEATKRIIKMDKGFIKIDKEQGFEYLDSTIIIYSLILRLRGFSLINVILNKEPYSKKKLLKFLETKLGKENTEIVYKIYTAIRDDKKFKEKVKIEIAEELISILEKEVEKLER